MRWFRGTLFNHDPASGLWDEMSCPCFSLWDFTHISDPVYAGGILWGSVFLTSSTLQNGVSRAMASTQKCRTWCWCHQTASSDYGLLMKMTVSFSVQLVLHAQPTLRGLWPRSGGGCSPQSLPHRSLFCLWLLILTLFNSGWIADSSWLILLLPKVCGK